MSTSAPHEPGSPGGAALSRIGAMTPETTPIVGRAEPGAAELARLLAAERERREAAEAALARARFVADVSARILDTAEYQTRVADLAQALVPTIGDWCAIDVLRPDGSLHRIAVAHPEPAKVALATELVERYPEDTSAPTSRARVLASGVPALIPEITDEMIDLGARDDEHRRILRELRLRSVVVAPLLARDGAIGTITVVAAESGRRYGDADVALVADLGRRVGQLIEFGRLHSELLEHRARLERQAVELEQQSAQLQQATAELETTNETLQGQAAELEIANEHLQQVQVELEAQADELREREERWHALAEAMPQLVWITDPRGNAEYFNARWYEYTGMRREGRDGSGWRAFLHPDDVERALDTWGRSLASGEPYESSYRLRRAVDGAYRWFIVRALPTRDAQGRIARWFGTCTDVHDERTARAEAEAAAVRADFLARASELLASSLDVEETLRQVVALAVPTLADWCVVDMVGPRGRLERLAIHHPDPTLVRLVNELEARYPDDPGARHGRYHVVRTGKPELVRELSDEMLAAASRGDDYLRIMRTLQLRSYVAVPLVGRDGVIGVLTLVFSESGRRYDDADAQLAMELGRRAAVAIENARLVAALRESQDMLQEQAAELEMQKEELEASAEELMQQTEVAEQARARAEEANHAKSQFLATMSHELRTPLNAISGYVDLLAMELRGPVTEPQREDLERIRRSGHHLLSLINDILNFARLEAGQVEFHTAEFPAGDVLAEVEPLILPQLGAKGLSYEAECADPALVARADPEKVRQVLLNLLSNALKFTEPGGMVRLRCEPAAFGSRKAVAYAVSDTGRGIPADRLESIFEPFVQVDRHLTSQSQQGVGLGLAISRDLARAMGGDLTVTSEEGRGSTFTVLLPAA